MKRSFCIFTAIFRAIFGAITPLLQASYYPFDIFTSSVKYHNDPGWNSCVDVLDGGENYAYFVELIKPKRVI